MTPHPYGDKYVTVILDLTPIRDRSGPSRLLDMIPGRSKRVFKTWLASQPDTWRERIEIVAMDGFTGLRAPPPKSSQTRGRSWTLPRCAPGR